jgi:hypothetical protein
MVLVTSFGNESGHQHHRVWRSRMLKTNQERYLFRRQIRVLEISGNTPLPYRFMRYASTYLYLHIEYCEEIKLLEVLWGFLKRQNNIDRFLAISEEYTDFFV